MSEHWRRLLDRVRTGDWITASRIRGYSLIVLGLAVAILIGWIVLDYRSQTLRLRELDRSGITRRSGRSATDRP